MIRTAALAVAVLALAACGGTPSDSQADADKAAADRAAEQAAAKKQKTVFDDQLKALDKARGVEQQLLDEKEKHDKEIEKQENGG
jgi:ABC-type glycerol-3-phosphate transport system substrate-binding protein